MGFASSVAAATPRSVLYAPVQVDDLSGIMFVALRTYESASFLGHGPNNV